MGEIWGNQLGVIGALFLSVASSVSIVICNKALMSNLGFPFATTLTSWHLMVTFCTLYVAQHFNVFDNKAIDLKTVIFFGILNGISIGLLNLSLGFNSIGFYQMTKLAIIPFTVLLETVFLKKQFSEKIKLSLFLLLVGVAIASVTDLQLNFLGSILSLLAIATTCVGQIDVLGLNYIGMFFLQILYDDLFGGWNPITRTGNTFHNLNIFSKKMVAWHALMSNARIQLTNTIQKRLNVSSTQLLYQSAPFQAAILFVSGPFVDQCLTGQNVFAHKYSSTVLIFIILSCFISVAVNFSTFLVIGKTSPVTYQVLGHLKTCLVLAFGYTLLHDPFTYRNIIGILVAILGMALYSYFCTRENSKKVLDLPSSQIKDKLETTPLMVGNKNMGHQDKEGHP